MSTMDDFGPPETPNAPSDLWLTADAVIAKMANEGAPVPSGWAPLDCRLRRGGLTPGRVFTVGGPPFTGKTTIVVDIALSLAQHIPVFALFSDEGRSQAAARMAVMLGVPIERVEETPSEAAPDVKDRLGERSLYLAKPDSEIANVTAVFDEVARRVPPGEPAGIILDSVQTIPPDGDDDGRSERERMLQFMKVVRDRSERDGRITILSSQSNRASYRSRNSGDNSVAMSSFSGAAIEFGFDFGMVLSLPDDESGIVKVEVVKNRLAFFTKKLPKVFHVRYDPASGRMMELDQAELDSATAQAGADRMRPIKQKLLEILKKHRDGLSASKLQELSSMRRIDVFSALKILIAEGKIIDDTVGRSVVYSVAE